MNATQLQAWRDGVKTALVNAGFDATNVDTAIREAEVEAVKQVILSQSSDLLSAIGHAIGPVVEAAKKTLGG